MSYRKGLKVWVEEKGEGWVEAEVVEAKERAVVVFSSQRKKVHHPPILAPCFCLSLSSHSVRFKFPPCRSEVLVDADVTCACLVLWLIWIWRRYSPLVLV